MVSGRHFNKGVKYTQSKVNQRIHQYKPGARQFSEHASLCTEDRLSRVLHVEFEVETSDHRGGEPDGSGDNFVEGRDGRRQDDKLDSSKASLNR